MANVKNKATIAIAIFMVLAMTTTMAFAQVYFPVNTQVPTYAFINVAPNPIGVGQQVNVNFFLSSVLESSERPTNMTVTITDPDGNTETKGPYTGDTTGGTFFNFIPDQVGEWKFQFIYGGQNTTGAPAPYGFGGLLEMPSESKIFTLTVQQEPLTRLAYPETPLPTHWWQTPVSAQNVQRWYKNMGSWLGFGGLVFASTGLYNATSQCNPYCDNIMSGHLLWTKVWCPGGVVGGDRGGNEEASSFWSTRQYWPQYAPVIMDGKMYSTWYPETTGYSAGILCTDLYTGETLWNLNTTNALRCGMETEWKTPNMYGVIGPYIWTTGTLPAADTGGRLIGTGPSYGFGGYNPGSPSSFMNTTGTQWNLYSALTGKYVLSVVNGTGLTLKEDAHGHLIGYFLNSTVGTFNIYNPASAFGSPTIKEKVNITQGQPMLVCFNMSQALGNAWGWSPSLNTVVDFGLGILWAKPVPTAIGGVPISPALSINALTGNTVVLSTGYIHMQGGGDEISGWMIIAGMDEDTGAVLTCKNYTYPTYQCMLPFTRTMSAHVDGVRVITNLVNWATTAIDVRTGEKLWEITLKTPYGDGTPNVYDNFGLYGRMANGKLLMFGLGGDMWCFNGRTGEQLWYTNTTTLIGDPGIETPYDVWPLWVFTPQAFTKEVAYIGIGHEYNPPLFHGAQLLAVNMTDGTLVWSELQFSIRSISLANGIMLSLNAYDNQIYAFGKGPTAMTVAAPSVGVTTATPITISGTIMDVSAGTKQTEQALMFPNGVPCVSDASQSKWMEYVYQDQEMPSSATGVTVTLSVLDANGNFREIGTTTSSPSGTYGFTWTPDIPGDYTLYASFAGSNSYYPSSAEAYFHATEAAAPEPTPEYPQPIDNTMTIVGGVVAIIIAIVVGFLVLYLLLRKR